MSSSAVVNRTQLLELLARLEAAVDADQGAPSTGEVVGANGAPSRASRKAEADRILAEATRERDRLIGETEVFRVAKLEAERTRSAAELDATELRRDADDYVDSRLATFEIALTKTLEAVARGRARLNDRSHFAALGEPEDGAAAETVDELTTPAELRPPAPEGDFEAPRASG